MNMPPYAVSIRVRYAETDRMGVVYHANYFVWFEVVRTEFFRSLGLAYRDIEEKRHLCLMVVEAVCRHKKPVTYDDTVRVETSVVDIRNTSITFTYRVIANGTVSAEGETVHVFTDRKGKPVRIPADIRAALSPSR
ncbi:MAG: thioesterase family protein [Candidatus Omnitrophota bacterium]